MKIAALSLILILFLSGVAGATGENVPMLPPIQNATGELDLYWAKYNSEAWYRLGVIYLYKDRLLEAFNAFYFSISYNPFLIDAYQNLSFTAFRMGDFREAAVASSIAIELEPQNAQAHHLLGVIYTIYSMYDNAAVELEKAASISPENSVIQYDLGFAREFAGRFTLAKESYEKALSINPAFLEAKKRLGLVTKKILQENSDLKVKELGTDVR